MNALFTQGSDKRSKRTNTSAYHLSTAPDVKAVAEAFLGNSFGVEQDDIHGLTSW